MPVQPAVETQHDAVDAVAVDHVLRRLARQAEAPWLHREVAQRMAERLPLIRQPPRRWIDWWAHLGGGAAAVRQAYPVAEPSAWRADEVPEAGAEMVWANMMLHACPDMAAMLAQWRRALTVNGFVMFSTLGPASLQELRALYGQRGFGEPHAPFADMHDIGDLLVHAGFADPVMDQELLTLTWSTPEAALRELRALGGNVHPRRAAGLRTPRWRQRLLRALEQRLDADGRVALSFELVYGHAFRPPPRARVAPTTTVSLSDLRSTLSSGRATG